MTSIGYGLNKQKEIPLDMERHNLVWSLVGDGCLGKTLGHFLCIWEILTGKSE